jgi:hypothetical protein
MPRGESEAAGNVFGLRATQMRVNNWPETALRHGPRTARLGLLNNHAEARRGILQVRPCPAKRGPRADIFPTVFLVTAPRTRP